MRCIRYEGMVPKTGDTSDWFAFGVFDGDERRGSVLICRTGSLDTLVLADRYEREAVDAATMRYAVREIEQLVAQGSFEEALADGSFRISLTTDDAVNLEALLGSKECRYQLRPDPDEDMYCSAAGSGDKTATATTGIRRLAPTTQSGCTACDLPSTDVLCSHFSHPAVIGFEVMGGPIPRRAVGGMCELGRPEVHSPSRCRPGDNDCWERALRGRGSRAGKPVPPLALHEALDFLDAVWQLTFRHALLGRIPAVTIAALAEPVTDRDSFSARMSELMDVVNRWDVSPMKPDGLEWPSGTLNQLHVVLAAQGVEGATDAVDRLRLVNKIRRALQHADRAHELRLALDELGVRTEPVDWSDAWRAVSSTTVDALRDIRDAIRMERQS